MRLHKLDFEGSYGAVQVSTGVATADSARLILMLFDGLLESLAVARGHITYSNVAGKGKAISRASGIVVGLQSALDFEQGGNLARNLDDLYSYVIRRLLHANANNDIDAIDEVRGLMQEIREAWCSLPGLMPSRAPSAVFN